MNIGNLHCKTHLYYVKNNLTGLLVLVCWGFFDGFNILDRASTDVYILTNLQKIICLAYSS